MTKQEQQGLDYLQSIVNQADESVKYIALVGNSLREYDAAGKQTSINFMDDDHIDMLRLYLSDDSKRSIAPYLRKDKIAKLL